MKIIPKVATQYFRAAQNAMEAHAHAHELACHVGNADLCKFHDGADHE